MAAIVESLACRARADGELSRRFCRVQSKMDADVVYDACKGPCCKAASGSESPPEFISMTYPLLSPNVLVCAEGVFSRLLQVFWAVVECARKSSRVHKRASVVLDFCLTSLSLDFGRAGTQEVNSLVFTKELSSW